MKIYTKTGDDGTTGLFSGKRVNKFDLRVEVYGTIDELNSIIGLAVSFGMPEQMMGTFVDLRKKLFDAGADFATPLNPAPKWATKRVSAEDVKYLEDMIDEYTALLPPLKFFILPGGTNCAAFLHQARTVCRRAERLAVKLAQTEELTEHSLKFLNRLSDFLFVASRLANFLAGVDDIIWEGK